MLSRKPLSLRHLMDPVRLSLLERLSGAEPAATAMSMLGFDASVDGDRIVLSACPCPLVAPDRPDLVCRLAGAVLDGVASASKQRLEVASSAHDPAARRCELTLSQ